MFPRSAKWFCLLSAFLAFTSAGARDKPDVWLEVRSPHFRVVTNAGEKQGRHVADQFERIRAVFHQAFPSLKVDPVAPIIVLAAKNEKTFNAMVPKEWLAKGALQRTGLFLRGPEKNYVLMRLNTPDDNPFHLLYHEYSHLILNQNPEPLPLWLDEGLAEFYGNSVIHEKDVTLGQPDASHIGLLQESKLIPLATLFTVDHSSPYYNESNKGSMFYAESWAVTHMLVMKSFAQKHSMINEFLNLLGQKVDTQTAAARAFGDLRNLQKGVADYVRSATFQVFRMRAETESDELSYAVRELTPAESNAARGDFLIYNQRREDARALLTETLQQDPKNAQASESMGFLEFQQGHPEEAKKWFTQAVQLNSRSYLAHYYYAFMMLQDSHGANAPEEIGVSLRKAIEINPQFAPAYGALASFYGMRGEQLDEAYRLVLNAIALDPGNVYNRMTAVNILLRQQRGQDALTVARRAVGMARSPDELAAAETMLASAQKYVDYLENVKSYNQQVSAGAVANVASEPARGPTDPGDEIKSPPVLRHRKQLAREGEEATGVETVTPPAVRHLDPAERGPRDTLTGAIKDVTCSSPASMEMTFVAGKQTVKLFSENYFTVQYSALNFTPTGELHPCQDLKGMKAQVYFYDLKGKPNEGELISVQLRK